MHGAELLYKCRRCGKISGGLHAPDGQTVLTCHALNIELPDKWGPMGAGYKTSICCCEKGIVAVADFIGVKYDGEGR